MIPTPIVVLAAVLAMSSGFATAADYSRYRVLETSQLDMMAGPANTAALLSPDGSRLLQVGGKVCVLARTERGTWEPGTCIDNKRDLGLHAPEDLLWSPRGDRLVMPTFVAGLTMFRDTDIRILDPETLTVTSLTEDGVDSSLLKIGTSSNFDVIARWVDDATVAFLRYPISKSRPGGPPSLMTIDAAGGEPKEMLAIPGADRLAVYVLAVSADGRQIAYSYHDRRNAGIAGIYLTEVSSTATKRVAPMAAVGQPPSGLAFSADGNFLLSIGSNETGLDARVLELATGKVTPVDSTRNITGVAWSPTGSALAYVTDDRAKAGKPGGLFLAARPGESGRQLMEHALMPPVCCGRLPLIWASNDTMVLGNVEKQDAPFFVRLGE